MADDRSHGRTAGEAALLALDPELGQLLPQDRRVAAERELLVLGTTIEAGPWKTERLETADPRHVGMLILDGVLARRVELEDTVSTELLGSGDMVRLWSVDSVPGWLSVRSSWDAMTKVRLALIDAHAGAALGRYPEVSAMIMDRFVERSRRLTVAKAISQLTRVDERLVALFWLLAERWGRVTKEGVLVPLVLSHRTVGELIGARRPTVSSAFSKLARQGQLARLPDGMWLLTGDHPAVNTTEHTPESVRQRRHLMPTSIEPSEPRHPAMPFGLEAVNTNLAQVRANNAAQRALLASLSHQAAALRIASAAQRAERARARMRVLHEPSAPAFAAPSSARAAAV